jgi:membrane protein
MTPLSPVRTLWNIAYSVGLGFFTNRLSTSAAAMAFYTMFAIGPIMIFSIAVAEPIVGRLMAQEAIFDALGTVLQPDQLASIHRYASQELFRGAGMAAIIGAVVLVYTGSRVFVELDDSINAIWSTPAVHVLHPVSPFQPVLATLQSRLLALGMMVILGLLLIAVILASVLISAYAGVLEKFPLLGVWIGPAISGFVHYGLLSAFFTLIYKWLPSGVPWRYALIGGAVNALLFAAGNRALVYYFEVTQLTSAFGATAGFAAIMVWMYWTSLTILLGAQIGRSMRDVLTQDRQREMVEGDL